MIRTKTHVFIPLTKGSFFLPGTSNGTMACWDMRFQLPISSHSHPSKARIRRLLMHPVYQSWVIAGKTCLKVTSQLPEVVIKAAFFSSSASIPGGELKRKKVGFSHCQNDSIYNSHLLSIATLMRGPLCVLSTLSLFKDKKLQKIKFKLMLYIEADGKFATIFCRAETEFQFPF